MPDKKVIIELSEPRISFKRQSPDSPAKCIMYMEAWNKDYCYCYYDQVSLDFWITLAKMFKGKGISFCVATRGKVWVFLVLASLHMNEKLILHSLPDGH